MKRLLLLFVALMSVHVSFGQLQALQISEGSSELIFKSQWMSVQKTGEAYDLLITSVDRTGSMIIHLGDSLSQAMITYAQIGEWFDTAAKKASLAIKGKDCELTLYKQNETTWIVTEGDAEYARKYFNDKMVQAFVKTSSPKRDYVSAPKIGYLRQSFFENEKAHKIFTGEDVGE